MTGRWLSRGRSRGLGLCLAISVSLGLGGCSLLGVVKSPDFADQQFTRPASTELADTPFYPSELHQCGPSALATLLGQTGVVVSPEQLGAEIYLPGREGTLSLELTAAVRRHERLPERLPPRLDAITAALAAGHAVLVLQNLGLDWLPRWHYATVLGYDAVNDEILLRSGVEPRQRLSTFTFEHTWSRSGRFAVIALRPEEPPLFTAEPDWLGMLAETRATPTAWRAATQRWPASAAAWFGLGNAWMAEGQHAQPQEAEQAWRQALALQPGFLPAANNLALRLAARGDRTAALTLLDGALQRATGVQDPAMRAALLRTRAEVTATTEAGAPALPPAPAPAANTDSNALR